MYQSDRSALLSDRRSDLTKGNGRVALHVKGSWNGWKGDTVVTLTDGSTWKQVEYYYEYLYAYRPEVAIVGGAMLVAGMNRAVRVRRV